MGTPDFTAHNISLDDGTRTLPGTELTADNAISQAALRLLREHLPGDPAGTRIADLGALEAGYSVAFARVTREPDGILQPDVSRAMFAGVKP